jgi:long-chain acyl-CoA synthetase
VEFKKQKNLVSAFQCQVQKYQSSAALYYKNPKTKHYQSISWNEFGEQVRDCAYAFASLGLEKGDRIGLISENRPEWAIADLSALSLGVIDVPIYATSAPNEVSYILSNSGAKALIASSIEQYERLSEALKQCRDLKKIIIFDETKNTLKGVLSFSEIVSLGKKLAKEHPENYQKWVDAVDLDDAATIIYTSGTTGDPKGVVLSHGNFLANVESSSHYIKVSEKDISLSFLPLSHVFERMAGYYFMLFHGAQIAYAESMKTVPDDLLIIKPTVAASVPRLYEKIHTGIYEKIQTQSKVVQKLFAWAIRVGTEKSNHEFGGKKVSLLLRLKYLIADKLVFKKIRGKLGGRLRFFISGGAPLPKELGCFFYAANILILEGYGLTETSPVIAVNQVDQLAFGTVGKPLPNVEVMIAEDGEILTRSDSVMMGYYQNDAATKEVIDSQGWFHTGDIGILDAKGFLKITDRKKDIIVTSGGKNISPQNIENKVLSDILFTQIVLVGDKRNYLVALIVPNKNELQRFAESDAELQSLDWQELIKHPKVYHFIGQRLELKTKELSRYEQIKYFMILAEELTQERGELTQTLKIKRKVIMERYKNQIDQLYARGENYAKEDKP